MTDANSSRNTVFYFHSLFLIEDSTVVDIVEILCKLMRDSQVSCPRRFSIGVLIIETHTHRLRFEKPPPPRFLE
jgi:hypothetical protein